MCSCQCTGRDHTCVVGKRWRRTRRCRSVQLSPDGSMNRACLSEFNKCWFTPSAASGGTQRSPQGLSSVNVSLNAGCCCFSLFYLQPPRETTTFFMWSKTSGDLRLVWGVNLNQSRKELVIFTAMENFRLKEPGWSGCVVCVKWPLVQSH